MANEIENPCQSLHDGIMAIAGHWQWTKNKEHMLAVLDCMTFTLVIAGMGEPTAREPAEKLCRAFWPNLLPDLQKQLAAAYKQRNGRPIFRAALPTSEPR